MTHDGASIYEHIDEDFFLLVWQIKESTARLFKRFDLRPEQAFILELVARGLTHPKDVAEALSLDPPLLSHYLSKLEERGLIERHLDPSDRRRTKIVLSREGQALREEARSAWRDLTLEMLGNLSEVEVAQLSSFLKRIVAARGRAR